jgi:4-amino-4-deoxychorismate lyase
VTVEHDGRAGFCYKTIYPATRSWTSVETLWLVNGQRTGVDPADRGLAYGDGLFETMAAERGRIRWLDWHLDRLAEGCRRLQLPSPPRAILHEEIAAHCPTDRSAVIKLIVTRGPGARGYRPPDAPHPTRILSVSPWPEFPLEHYAEGVRVRVCDTRLGENPALAGLKHLCRLEQVLAQLELRDSDAQHGLLLDTGGRVIGGTSSNVFAVRNAAIVTPALTRCGVKGVMRRAVMAAALELDMDIAERDLTLADVLAAEELFLTNALFGIWPIAWLDDKTFAAGPVTRRLTHHLGIAHRA